MKMDWKDALKCPFPAALNPHVEYAEECALDWARRYGMLTEHDEFGVTGARVGYLSAAIYPSISQQALRLATAWLDWLLVYDDLWNDKQARVQELNLAQICDFHARMLEILNGSPIGERDDPLCRFLHDIWIEHFALCPSWDPQPFLRTFQNYLQANLWEITNIWEGRMPALPTYTTMRRHTSCMLPMYEISCALTGTAFPAQARSHVALEQMTLSSINYLVWLNDIVSVERERADGTATNLVLVLQRQNQSTPKEAVRLAAGMCRAELDSYLEFKDRLPRLGVRVDEGVSRYLAVLESWMSGLLDWSKVTRRYAVPTTDTKTAKVGTQG